ncbi:thiamine diphosphokinase, partial [Suttonella ornithocola]
MSERLWILLNGDFALADRLPFSDEPIIAVDGGIRHAQHLMQSPNLWLGDFDSATIDYPHIARETYPSDKDYTDFELALAYAHEHYSQRDWHIMGSAGDEADHSFGNLWTLPKFGRRCFLWQKNALIFFGKDQIQLSWQAALHSKVSIFALTPLEKLSNSGLKWTLNDSVLSPYCALAARNEMIEEKASV